MTTGAYHGSWPADLGDEEILERLLALNLERAGQSENGGTRQSTLAELGSERPGRVKG